MKKKTAEEKWYALEPSDLERVKELDLLITFLSEQQDHLLTEYHDLTSKKRNGPHIGNVENEI